MTEGIILKGIGGFYYVDTPEGLIECKARGRFRRTVGKPIVGDRVTLEIQPEDGTGYLLDIAPRKNSLVRPAVANLDLLVAVASAAPPVTDPFLIDRVTAIAVHKDMDVLVVINKTDENPGDELYETYRKSGIQTLRVSALTGDGIDALKAYIRGKVSAFAGNSGVGKSSVLNRIDPQFGAAVGAISESDVMLADASNAIIVGFNVRPDPVAKENAERDGVELRLYRIIYDAINDVETAMKGMLAPKTREVDLGRAEVRQVYKITGVGAVAGCYVLEGRITRSAEIRVVRDGIIIADDKLASLKRFKDDVKEVAKGYECGMGLTKFNDIKEGDIFEAYEIEEYRE